MSSGMKKSKSVRFAPSQSFAENTVKYEAFGSDVQQVLADGEPPQCVSNDDDGDDDDRPPPLTFWDYLSADLMGSYSPATNVYQQRDRVQNFLSVPSKVEKLVLFGTAVCCDAVLFYFTFLPVRLIVALFRVLRHVSLRALNGSQLVDFVRLLLFGSTLTLLWALVDPSILYHIIRGQTVVKLYVIFNLLEIVEKLLRSFGPDAIESLFWSITASRGTLARGPGFTLTMQLCVAAVYCVTHALVQYVQIITLNVAINSQSHMLVTLLLSNQFIELKTCVYKKYDMTAVAFMLCCDMVERFQLLFSLFVVCCTNLQDLHFDALSARYQATLWAAFVCYQAECVVDWVKHAFVASYNRHNVTRYAQFERKLRIDLLEPQPGLFGDASHTTTRTIAFSPLPVACVAVRALWRFVPALSRASVKLSAPIWLLVAIVVVLLWSAKLALTFMIFRMCSKTVASKTAHAETNANGGNGGGDGSSHNTPTSAKLEAKDALLKRL